MEAKVKTGGRKKGTPNKDTKQIRDNFQMLVEGNLEQLDQDIKSMTAKDRVKTILELSKFILPTLKAVESSSTMEAEIRPIIIHLGEGVDPNHI
jgi:hypothetical protein